MIRIPLLYLQFTPPNKNSPPTKSMGNIYKLYNLYPTHIASGKHLQTESFLSRAISKRQHLLVIILYTVYLEHSTIFLHLKAVPYTPNRLNVLRVGGVKFNFLTNFLNMNGNRCNVADGIHIPNFAEQF